MGLLQRSLAVNICTYIFVFMVVIAWVWMIGNIIDPRFGDAIIEAFRKLWEGGNDARD